MTGKCFIVIYLMCMRKNIFRVLFGLVVLIAIFLLQREFADSRLVQDTAMNAGYLGVVAFTFFNSFNYFVPIVTPTLLPTWTAAGLSPILTTGLIIIVITLTDIAFYLLGRYSRRFTEHVKTQKYMVRIRTLRDKSRFLPLVVFAVWILVVPLPNELVVVPLGILGYKLLPVACIALVGNAIFNGVIAYNALLIIEKI